MSTSRHFLLLVPKLYSDERRRSYADDVKEVLEEQIPGLTATTMDSVDWYARSFARCGSWDAWTWDIVNGKEYGYTKPRFDGFIVPEVRVGRATASVLDLALRNRRFVARISEGQNAIYPIERVIKNESDSWIDGWDVVCKELVS